MLLSPSSLETEDLSVHYQISKAQKQIFVQQLPQHLIILLLGDSKQVDFLDCFKVRV